MDEALRIILTLYEEAEIELFRILSKRLTDDSTESNWAALKLREIKRLRAEIIPVIQRLQTADEIGKQAIIAEYLGRGSSEFLSTNKHIIDTLVTDYLRLNRNTRLQILRSTDDIYRQVIFSVVRKSAVGVQTRIETARNALSKFATEGVTSFVAKDGRRWEMRSYIEVATRTTLANAQREGRLAQIDGDLIIVRTSPRYCELCSPWKDKILSVSGTHPDYPSLADAKYKGLFHPNCRCSFAKYVSGLTKISTKESIDNNYESEQEQRELERRIRATKRVLTVDPTNPRARVRLEQYQADMRELVSNENLTRKRNRESNFQSR